jgi:Flp pilus assembly protein TadD
VNGGVADLELAAGPRTYSLWISERSPDSETVRLLDSKTFVMAGKNPKLAKALEALSQADFSTAIGLLSEVVVEDAENSEAWMQLGVCYLETRQPDLALEALSRAAKANPDGATTHYLLGNALGSLGNLERAAASYRRALELEPHHAKAEEFLIKAESLLASREHYRTGLRLLYSSSPGAAELNQALRELIQSAAIFPESPARDNLLECARRLFALKTELPIPLRADPELNLWCATCQRGWQCMRFSNWMGARAAYEEALSYRTEDAFVHHALGFSLAELGDLDGALRAWMRVLELDPGYDFTHFGYLAAPSS